MRRTTTALIAATVALSAAPVANAATDAVYLGGTGTGYGPQNSDTFTPIFVTDPGVTRPVLYDGAPWMNPTQAVPIALRVLAATPGPAVVIGVSKGAQAARATERVDPDPTTRYVLIGDPDSATGMSRAFGLSSPLTTPTHDTEVVFGEYDGFADWPDRPNPLAVANAAMGIVYVHVQYGTGSADDPLTRLDEAKVTVSDNGNGTATTTRMVPTKNLPLTRPLRDTEKFLTGQTGLTDTVDAVIRPTIDAGYSRNGSKATPTKARAGGNRAAVKKVTKKEAKRTLRKADHDG